MHRLKNAVIILITLLIQEAAAQERAALLIELEGRWAFSIGINDEWISPGFDDSDWETIRVPENWEDQGFNGYNGYAFYRKEFTIPPEYRERNLYLNLGYIDDVDEAFFNGHKIGSTGRFPPGYITAYNAERRYYIPEDYINFDGTNILAVRVYDLSGAGGIVSGDIGLYGERSPVSFEVNFQTTWKFRTGDDPVYKVSDYDDHDWEEIFVPARWEDQGYRDYDGWAWYRKSFSYSGNTNDMVLVMGRIYDIDQVFINGRLVGSTGNFDTRRGEDPEVDDEYDNFRGYYIPDGVLMRNRVNVIAVRVFDRGRSGGIYEGPVGLMTGEQYSSFRRRDRHRD